MGLSWLITFEFLHIITIYGGFFHLEDCIYLREKFEIFKLSLDAQRILSKKRFLVDLLILKFLFYCRK